MVELPILRAPPGLGSPPLTVLLSPQPFRCAHCHYSCNMSGSLKRHYNRKHPNEEYANVGAGELAADALVRQGRRTPARGPRGPRQAAFLRGRDLWSFNPGP